MDFNRVWNWIKRKKNKVLATAFSSAALLLLSLHYLIMEVSSGFAFFRREPLELWNFVLYLVVYINLLVTNIRNDDRAYTWILMFVFFITFDIIFDTIQALFGGILILMTPSGLIYLAQLAIMVAESIFGVLLYINIRRYMMGFEREFKKIRTYGIIWFVSMFVLSIIPIVLVAVESSGLSFLLFLIPLSEIALSASVLFTMERLRRL